MATFEFTITATGIDPERDDLEETFFAAGCDDATVAFQRGMLILDFTREARSFDQALASAVRDVATTGPKFERIEPQA